MERAFPATDSQVRSGITLLHHATLAQGSMDTASPLRFVQYDGEGEPFV